MNFKFFLIASWALWPHAAAGRLLGIPTAQFTPAGGNVAFNGLTLTSIVVDRAYSESRDENGMTLIPPTLKDFAETFAADLASVLGWNASVALGSASSRQSIFLTLGEPNAYLDAAGRPTSEGYSLTINEESVIIRGASPLGVWWGTRTLLQQLVLGNGTVPIGKSVDAPGWATRGIMLDAARHYYPPEFLIEMCAYLSFFKQNTFQLHLSDNLWNNAAIYTWQRFMELYATFRLLSDDPAVAGLNWRVNESYTFEQFEEIQTKCAARGVTILPEIEAPGHALVIAQWKNQIGFRRDPSLLNISHPDTLPTMKTIWGTFLPWFHSKVVSIGADEYVDASLTDDALAVEYGHYVNEMNKFIRSTSGKKVHIWGTFPPYTGADVDKSVAIQHWALWEDKPLQDFIKNGYDVLNSGDAVYVVGKWSGSYPQVMNQTFIFHGAPGGGPFSPNIFDGRDASNNAPRNSPAVLGHIAPLWNDYGPNSTVYSEAYYSWRNALPGLGDKQWGGDLLEDEYAKIFNVLHAAVPGQNLDRSIPSKSATILDLDFVTGKGGNGTYKDTSGNGYHARTNCGNTNEGIVITSGCSVATPLSSKGRDYTLSFSIKPTSTAKGTIFAGSDSELWFGNGSSSAVMLFAGGNAFALNYAFPVGKWTSASLIGRGTQTFLKVGNSAAMEFFTILGVNGVRFVQAPMAIEAPLAKIGGNGFEGIIGNMKLVDHAVMA